MQLSQQSQDNSSPSPKKAHTSLYHGFHLKMNFPYSPLFTT